MADSRPMSVPRFRGESALYLYLGRKAPRVTGAAPRLPNRAEIRYLSGMVRWARAREEALWAVLEDAGLGEVVRLAKGARTDAVEGGGAPGVLPIEQILAGLRVILASGVPYPDLYSIGEDIGSSVSRNSARCLGIENANIAQPTEIALWREENARLIKDLSERQYTRIGEILREYDGIRVEDLAKKLAKEQDFTARRGRLVARDQTLKLNGRLTRASHEAAGVTKYRWLTARDGSVRDDHADLDGEIFSYSDPPVVDQRTGRTGNPGEDYQCRCVPVPVIDELL